MIDLKKSLNIGKAYGESIEPNDCYANAFCIARSEQWKNELRKIYVVLGKVNSIPHSWIEIDGIEIDPSYQFFQSEECLTYLAGIKLELSEFGGGKLDTALISQAWNSGLDPRDCI